LRRIIVHEHLSLDGVIQGPGGPDEDPSGGFALGGWIRKYSDPILGDRLRGQMNSPFDLLLGRKTYDIWAPYWPQHPDAWPNANRATKYVASNSVTSGSWHPTTVLSGDIVTQIEALKRQPGPDLHVWGSTNLVQTLLKHDLLDAFWLLIYPLTLGVGKRLFAAGTIPLEFRLRESTVTPSGVLSATYERSATDRAAR